MVPATSIILMNCLAKAFQGGIYYVASKMLTLGELRVAGIDSVMIGEDRISFLLSFRDDGLSSSVSALKRLERSQ